MKKICVIVAALMLIVMFIPAFTSCTQKIGDYDVTFFRPGMSTAETDPIVMAIQNYKDLYGAKVTVATAGWGDYITKVIANAAAGKAFDVVFGSTNTFPYYFTKELVQPIDKYVDLKNETLNISLMDSAFRYNNSYYMAASKSYMYTGVLTWYVYYNADAITEAGFDTPLEMYQNGEWNYDNFAKIGKAFTERDSETGEIAKYGCSSWWWAGWIWGNGTSMLSMDKSGQLSENTSDIKLLNGIQAYLDNCRSNDAWFEVSGAGVGNFTSGKSVMTCEREFAYNDFARYKKAGTLNFNFECVPFPYGPDNKEGYNVMDADGLCIGNKCKNPKAAGVFIDEYMTFLYDLAMSDAEQTIPKEVRELFEKTAANAKLLSFRDSAICGTSGNYQFDEVITASYEKSPATALKEYSSILAATCQELNIKPDIKPFVQFDPLTFENADLVKQLDSKAKLEIVTEDAIEGSSLKITFNKQTDVSIIENVDAVGTDVSKIPLTGWHSYKVSFDVKFMDLLGDDEYYYMAIVPEGKSLVGFNKFGPITQDDINVVFKQEFVFDKVQVNSDKISIVFGSKNGGTIIIDNLTVVENVE